jgi:S-adenosylmethionine hydrolase
VIFLLTDYGYEGPYRGLLHGAAARIAPHIPVIDLMHDLPRFAPRPSSYLLAALLPFLPEDAIVAAVVDPGVGGARPALVAEIDGRFLVLPGNGLAAVALKRARHRRLWQLAPPAHPVSASFHGRDIFVPAAARLALGERPGAAIAAEEIDWREMEGASWPDDLPEIVYIDSFGNCMTGLRAAGAEALTLEIATPRGPLRPMRARTFGDLAAGGVLLYANSLGLLEIAVNQGRADRVLGLEVGSPVRLLA